MNPTAARTRARRAGGWIAGPPPGSTPAVRLFCLPFVGGAAWAYDPWRGQLSDRVDVCAIELPGRGARLREPVFTRLEPLVDALATALAPAITGELDVPYALFGHSMGSLVAFELARELRRRGAGEPCVLFASGGPSPRLTRRRVPLHGATDDEVIAGLRRLGGLPGEVEAEPRLLTAFLPTIRADFEVYETYEYRPEQRLSCPVVAFTGSEDDSVAKDRVLPWEQETTGPFQCHVLPGGHFFLRTAQQALLELVDRALTACGEGATR